MLQTSPNIINSNLRDAREECKNRSDEISESNSSRDGLYLASSSRPDLLISIPVHLAEDSWILMKGISYRL